MSAPQIANSCTVCTLGLSIWGAFALCIYLSISRKKHCQIANSFVKAPCQQLTYVMYVRVAGQGAFSRSSSQYRTLSVTSFIYLSRFSILKSFNARSSSQISIFIYSCKQTHPYIYIERMRVHVQLCVRICVCIYCSCMRVRAYMRIHA